MPVFRFFSRYAWLLVIVAGLLIIIVPLIFHNPLFLKNNSLTAQNSKSAVKTAAKKNNNPIEIASALLSDRELSEPPQRIIIPSLNIDLPINEARVVNGFWELSETTASHGIGSANPGQNGNIVVFAHAREGLFLPLTNIRQEDEVIVLTKDHWYRYRVFKIKTVSPDNIEVISPTKTEQLTIFTCTGFLDGQRLIVSASPMR